MARRPESAICPDVATENERVAAFPRAAVDDDIASSEIGLFVRSRSQIARAHAAVEAAGLAFADFTDRSSELAARVEVGVMHLAKGLEFKAVVVMACDTDVLSLRERIRRGDR